MADRLVLPAGHRRRPEELPALLAPLLDRGFVAAGADSVAITSEGERTVAALWPVQERVEDGLYEGFSQTERDQLQSLLRRVQDNALRLTSRLGR